MVSFGLNAEDVARALGGKRAGRQWVARCPAHADRNPSLIIFDGREQVQVRCLAGCEPRDVIAALRATGLWSGSSGAAAQPWRINDDAEAKRNGEIARAIWDEAVDLRGTLAEVYLRGRGLTLPLDCSTLRFHPRCPRGNERQPALIAAMYPYDRSKPVAIQRVFLTRDGGKDGAMMLGPAGGAAMKITPHHRTFWDELSYCPRLYVTEGLETALAQRQRDYWPVWALGSAGAIERFPVLFGVGELVICADNDKPGLDAAQVCQTRWNDTTHQLAMIWTPDKDGTDFADDPGGEHAQAAAS